MGNSVRMRLIELGHAAERREMFCNPLRGRFDPVLLENFVILPGVFVWIRPGLSVRLLQRSKVFLSATVDARWGPDGPGLLAAQHV